MVFRALSAASLALALLGAAAAPAAAQDATRTAQWKTFFGQVLPYAPQNFAGIRGGKEAGHLDDNYYSVTASFDSTLAQSCSINSNVYWSLYCETLPEYLGPDARASLGADIQAALPDGFTQSTDSDGDPEWHNGATVILLIDPQSDTDAWGISIGNNP